MLQQPLRTVVRCCVLSDSNAIVVPGWLLLGVVQLFCEDVIEDAEDTLSLAVPVYRHVYRQIHRHVYRDVLGMCHTAIGKLVVETVLPTPS